MTSQEEVRPRQSLVRRVLIVLSAVIVALILCAVIAVHVLRPKIHAMARDRAVQALQSHFESQVEFSDFKIISIFPKVHVTIYGLVMRHHGRTDIPPLFQISKATVTADFMSLMRPEPHIAFIELEGLQIHTPPKTPGGSPLIGKTDQDLAKKYPVLVDEVHAQDAIIVVLRAQPGKDPREFPIHDLLLHNLSFDSPAVFHATLTNAVPKGEIDADGKFGPWIPSEPSDTPATGDYTFENADMGTLKGLQGTLSSKGSFTGPLDYLTVEGVADIPDFSLRTADHPMALHTEFSATVDGTNGNTYLKSVTAKFLHTTLFVSGEVVDMDRNVKGRTIELDAVSRDAHAEDLIRLAVKGSEPIMTGAVKLKAHIDIPEGTPDLIDRMKLKGQFGIDEGQFTSAQVQSKIDTLSRKGQGQPKDMGINGVTSEMKGSFTMGNAAMNFSDLAFDVPGASIKLSGTYNLNSGTLDFHGKLALQAKLSQTTTGAKSFFLKALDPFFKGKDAGTVLAIKIGGTKDNPSFGLDHGGPSEKSDKEDPAVLKKGQ